MIRFEFPLTLMTSWGARIHEAEFQMLPIKEHPQEGKFRWPECSMHVSFFFVCLFISLLSVLSRPLRYCLLRVLNAQKKAAKEGYPSLFSKITSVLRARNS